VVKEKKKEGFEFSTVDRLGGGLSDIIKLELSIGLTRFFCAIIKIDLLLEVERQKIKD